jgi:hypothetical protein
MSYSCHYSTQIEMLTALLSLKFRYQATIVTKVSLLGESTEIQAAL